MLSGAVQPPAKAVPFSLGRVVLREVGLLQGLRLHVADYRRIEAGLRLQGIRFDIADHLRTDTRRPIHLGGHLLRRG